VRLTIRGCLRPRFLRQVAGALTRAGGLCASATRMDSRQRLRWRASKPHQSIRECLCRMHWSCEHLYRDAAIPSLSLPLQFDQFWQKKTFPSFEPTEADALLRGRPLRPDIGAGERCPSATSTRASANAGRAGQLLLHALQTQGPLLTRSSSRKSRARTAGRQAPRALATGTSAPHRATKPRLTKMDMILCSSMVRVAVLRSSPFPGSFSQMRRSLMRRWKTWKSRCEPSQRKPGGRGCVP
jgi:hypothetical protein